MKILKASAWLLVAVNFWIFSRLTVDDAFITWRYGKNLITHGIWNYNPSTFDLTQAYTNPIFALLSILPAALGLNVVLFFKVFEFILAAGLIFWMLRKRPESQLPLALFFAVPATMIHLFSGLETFLFVVLMFAVFVGVLENKVSVTIWSTSILFLTRPEGWLLGLLVPLALNLKASQFGRGFAFNWKRFLLQSAGVGTVLAAYFALHFYLFNEVLPNTFFVKGQHTLIPYYFWTLSTLLLPLVPLWLLKLRRLVGLALAFMLPLIVSYSSSTMGMDYASRFAFHIYGPLALLNIYVLSSATNRKFLRAALQKLGVKLARFVVAAVPIVIAVGFLIPTLPQDQLSLATSYPRTLDAHAKIGELAKSSATGMAMMDSGLAPYLAEKNNLDINLLGTRLGSKSGLTENLFEKYQVDFVAYRPTRKLSLALTPIFRQIKLTHLCNVYLSPDYEVELWMKVRTKAAYDVCRLSQKENDIDKTNYFWANVTKAPWNYWN